jgi:DNA polymerase I
MKTVLLIDAQALIHRSFHALPPLSTPDGRPVGALYGLSSTLVKLLTESVPDYAAAMFDRPEPTFRKKEYAAYKAQRPPTPEDLVTQIVAAHELFATFGIPSFELAGFEADDLIGTFVEKLKSPDRTIVILTGDLDTLQLVEGDRVVVRSLKKGITETVVYDERAVHERFGLSPGQMTDYKGLVGDQSDNIPGVRGVGPKTASKLLAEYRTLETLLERLPGQSAAERKIVAEKEQALFSKKLATIRRDAPIEVRIEDIRFDGLDTENLSTYFTGLGFESLVRRIGGQARPVMKAPGRQREQQATLPLPADVLIVTDVEDARSHQDALTSASLKVAPEWKLIVRALAAAGQEISPPIFDLSVAGWLLDPDRTDFSLNALASTFLPGRPDSDPRTTTASLFPVVNRELHAQSLMNVFETIEMPLVPILAEMERTGIAVDRGALQRLADDMERSINAAAERIYAAVGTPFNINSPRQVADIVFERLKLKPSRVRKTTTGQRRTGRDILEALRDAHPAVPLILDYREDFKVRSGFVAPLLELIGSDGRIHTTFIQTGTSTGRLASEKPNLQNIPQESRWSTRLREAFVAADGWTLLSLDYSQLELRLLAHMTGDEGLARAFRDGKDIHTLTASRVFHTTEAAVTKEMRRIAKTLNFGIVYGMGARAFAETSGLQKAEAEHFIADYFAAFPSIRRWQEEVRTTARNVGYVTNANGRRRWFHTHGPRNFGEFDRAAINMPLQSLGADIIKLAMVRSSAVLAEHGWLGAKVRLALSIHDELLFEVRDDTLSAVTSVLVPLMERVFPLAVPLVVDTAHGKHWGTLA